MTTIAANLREMAGDTKCSYEGIGNDTYGSVKLFVANGAIYGVSGEDTAGSIMAIEWLQMGANAGARPGPMERVGSWTLLELSKHGLAYYNNLYERESVLDGCIAIGSGRKVALYCMQHLGMSPAEAVAEACKADSWSAPPIYVASIKNCRVTRWKPTKQRARKR